MQTQTDTETPQQIPFTPNEIKFAVRKANALLTKEFVGNLVRKIREKDPTLVSILISCYRGNDKEISGKEKELLRLWTILEEQERKYKNEIVALKFTILYHENIKAVFPSYIRSFYSKYVIFILQLIMQNK